VSLFRLYHFYRDGFRSMTLGRTLWRLVGIKVLIIFAVLKLFFFPDILATRFSTDDERAEHVLQQLVPATAGRHVTTVGEGQ
jgi:hypothetical protein